MATNISYGDSMDTHLLKLAAHCLNNEYCLFEGKDVDIDVTITNISPDTIGLPVNYFKRKGIHCMLIDNVTNTKIAMDISLTPASIKREFTAIAPGETIHLSHEVSADVIRAIRVNMVDLTVNLGIGGLMQLHNQEEPVRFTKEINVRILSPDTLQREKEEK